MANKRTPIMSKPTLVYAEHIEFLCIIMTNGQPDPSIPPRPYTHRAVIDAIYDGFNRSKVYDLMLYHAHTDEDGDIWIRVANPLT